MFFSYPFVSESLHRNFEDLISIQTETKILREQAWTSSFQLFTDSRNS